MIRPVTFLCMLLAGASGLYLYQVKQRTRVLEMSIDQTVKQANAARERTGMLQAEWALLNDPSRLSELASQHLKLTPMAPSQFVQMADLGKRLPAPVAPGAPAQQPMDQDDDAGVPVAANAPAGAPPDEQRLIASAQAAVVGSAPVAAAPQPAAAPAVAAAQVAGAAKPMVEKPGVEKPGAEKPVQVATAVPVRPVLPIRATTPAQTDRAQADRTQADRAVADRNLADRTLADRAVAERALAERKDATRPAVRAVAVPAPAMAAPPVAVAMRRPPIVGAPPPVPVRYDTYPRATGYAPAPRSSDTVSSLGSSRSALPPPVPMGGYGRDEGGGR